MCFNVTDSVTTVEKSGVYYIPHFKKWMQHTKQQQFQ